MDGGVFGDFGRGEAEAGGDDGVDLEVGGGAADGVLDAVLHVDDAGDLADGVADARAELVEQGFDRCDEELDLDGLGRVGEVADHVLQDLDELDVESGSLALILRADVGDDFVDGAAALGFELDGEVAGVGFGDGGEAHLQAGAAGGAFDFGRSAQDPFDVLEDAVGLGERAAGGHDVVEDEAAFVHLREQVGAEGSVAE